MKRIFDQRGMSLLALLVALAIISLMCFFAFKSVKKSKDVTANKDFIQGAGVDTSNYKGMLDSTKEIIKDAEATRARTP